MNNSILKASSRKTHRKTRTGCRTCKERKIKCGEQRPACHNCIKYSVQCDFLASLAIGSGNGLSHGRATVTLNTNPSSALNLADLELLHNYVTSTAFTTHTDPAMKISWGINRRDFYIQLAMLQHETGLRVSTEVLATIMEENCTGVYAFSALTLFFTLGSPRKPCDLLLVGENRMADWLFLVKGTSFIGLLGPRFLSGTRQSQVRAQILAEKLPQDDPLVELGNLVAQNSLDELNKHVYLAAIDTLRRTFAFHNQPGSPGYKTRDVFTWIFKVPEEFLQLLRQHTQESLTIFAYFCVVLNRLDSHWWMRGWSSHLVSKIWNLLDEEHQLWIRWPLEEIGWIPRQ
ncbi:hypothetical protein BKA61DRAFT_646994 [Leptodontidium sp. MPI-SDFR-AT-0119]|nr:hypothetical protein BKA61DRAFT_646994 [Leptodontidium sp. MPI-SDFR-AT-0119]